MTKRVGEIQRLIQQCPWTEITEIPVLELTAEDAILWLWTTNTHLPDAVEIVKALGLSIQNLVDLGKEQDGNRTLAPRTH